MPLKVVRRKSTGALTIAGTVAGQRIQRRAQSDRLALAEEEAAALEIEILRSEWHGERRGSHTLTEAIIAYCEAKQRSEDTKARLRRIREALGDATTLREIDQGTIPELGRKVLRAGAGDAALLRGVVIPLRAVLHHVARRGWCDPPRFETPKRTQGRTLFMLPDEAERLISAASPHLQSLLVFLICTGARLSEALYLEWRDVDLVGARAIFWGDRTKNGKRRIASIPPRAVAALGNSKHRDGEVVRRPDGQPYIAKDGEGGQIKRAWAGAIRRAGLNPDFTPHTCRHTWASWHYAIHRDLLRLKIEGGWSSVELVERYAHLMPASHEAAIRQFLGTCDLTVTGEIEH